MTTRLLTTIDTSRPEEIRVTIASVNKNGVTGDEKLLASKLVSTMAKAKGFPKIAKLNTSN